MPTLSKAKLSGSTDGRAIRVAATATPGTLVHTAVAGTGDNNFDELTLYAMNSDTVARKLTIEFGGVTVPDDLIEISLPPEGGRVRVVDQEPLQNGVAVRAYAAVADVVMISGSINKVRP
jgi:hypothetical protein